MLKQIFFLCQTLCNPIIIIIMTLQEMGTTHMAQRVAENHTLIAGRLHLQLEGHYQRPLGDINCTQGYAVELTGQPVQNQTPKELTFNHKELENLLKEVEKVITKWAITPVPKEQAAKGFHSQLFGVPKKDGADNQSKAIEPVCGGSTHTHAEGYPKAGRPKST